MFWNKRDDSKNSPMTGRGQQCSLIYTHFSTLFLSVMLLMSSGGVSVSSSRSCMHGGDSRLYGAMFQARQRAPNFVYKNFEVGGTGCSFCFFFGIFLLS